MTWPLQPLRQSGLNQPVQGAKDGSTAKVRVLAADSIVEFLRRGLLATLRQGAGDGEPLWC